MNVLPIVMRELQVASRRKSTHRIRWISAGIAILISGFSMGIFSVISKPTVGSSVFHLLSGYAFGLCLVAGVFLTGDALSEEKREGTLGLLFLTDLHGYDIVLGKFMARSLNAFYGLLACLPILALPLMAGGVTGREFWLVSIALLNTLFFSLTLGICVSTVSRNSQRALAITAALVFVIVAGGYVIQVISNVWPSAGRFVGFASGVSPLTSFAAAFSANSSSVFWSSMLTSHLLAWLLLAIASFALPMAWQDRPFRAGRWHRHRAGWSRQAAAAVLDRDPMLWLIGRGLGWQVAAWALALAVVTVVAVVRDFAAATPFMMPWVLAPFFFFLKVIVAIRATQFFAQARQSGALELLFSTPITSQAVVGSQWLSMRKTFLWPLVIMSASILVATYSHGFDEGSPMAFMFAVYLILKVVLDVMAVTWLGMLLPLRLRRPQSAGAWTVFGGVLLPSMALCIPNVIIDAIIIAYCIGDIARILRTRAGLLGGSA